MAEIKFARYVELKAKVKAEMLRRNGTGSVATYGGTSYDYEDASGQMIRKEHHEKNAVPLHAVNSTDLPTTSGDRPIKEDDVAKMEAKVLVLGSIGMTSTSHGCAASCTGLCSTTCNTACSGCSGCSGGCLYGCSGCGSGCASGCYGCGSGCASGCSGCDGGCRDNCASGCSGSCIAPCNNTCSGGCTGCTSCEGGSCSGSCWAACRSTCTNGNK